MPTLNIDGVGKVTPVDPNFFSLPLEEQAKQVDEIISTAKNAGMHQDQKPDAAPSVAGFGSNVVSSAGNAVSNMAQPFIHPIQTAENIGTLGKGVLQKAGAISGTDAISSADAVGKMLTDRYGGWDNIKKTAYEDPIGFLMDASMLFTGGGSALARAPGIVGKVGEAAATAGRVIDPLNAVAKVAGPVVRGAGKVAAEGAGITTGAGGEALLTAAHAGATGGESAKAFKAGATGTISSVDVVNAAKDALTQMKADRGVEYRTAMAKIGEDTKALDFNKIDEAVQKVSGVKTYKGQDLSPTTKGIRADMASAIDDWKNLPADQFHTAEGLDALKQKLGDMMQGTQAGTPERVVAREIYNGVRQTIIDQAPEYAKIMKGYEEASDIIKEIEKTLSLGEKASIDTSLRKLQSVLRNNVSTNYGRRTELVDYLRRNGAPHLMEYLAGQALSSIAPRGLSRLAATGEGSSALTALALGHPLAAATLGTAVTGSSPGLMGRAAYRLGSLARIPGRTLGQTAFQLGRVGQ